MAERPRPPLTRVSNSAPFWSDPIPAPGPAFRGRGAPQLQIGRQQEVTTPGTIERYPVLRPGLARRGAAVYRANGCVECHTRQVLPRGLGPDRARGWGQRRTVAQDYLRDDVVQLGQLRLGPDLSNIGVRQSSAAWHLLHLYQPRSTTPGSSMPPYRYLFEKRKVRPDRGPAPTASALGDQIEPGWEIVPSADAQALAAYLLSLNVSTPLLEAPVPVLATNLTPAPSSHALAITNAPAPAPAP